MKKYIGYFIVLILCVGCGFGIYFFLQTKPKEEKSEFQDVVITDPAIQLLYERANPSDSVISLGDVYKKGTFSNEFILGAAFVDFLRNHPNDLVVSEENINESVHKIFGDITYAHDSGYIVSPYLCAFRHNVGEKSYTYLKGCDGSLNSYLSRKIVSAIKSETEYIITEKLVYVKSNWDEVINTDQKNAVVKVYSDINETKLINEISYLWESEEEPKIKVDDYLDSASTYKYHFVFDGENFVYKKLEKASH